MAGKEQGGIERADAGLFTGAVWVTTPLGETTALAANFLELVAATGARVVSMEPERHDRLCAWLSHLPQMVSTALAASRNTGKDPICQIKGTIPPIAKRSQPVLSMT